MTARGVRAALGSIGPPLSIPWAACCASNSKEAPTYARDSCARAAKDLAPFVVACIRSSDAWVTSGAVSSASSTRDRGVFVAERSAHERDRRAFLEQQRRERRRIWWGPW